MRVELRRRTLSRTPERTHLRHDVVLIAETSRESAMLDLLGNTPLGADREMFGRGEYEIRTSDDFQVHYVLLRGTRVHVLTDEEEPDAEGDRAVRVRGG